MSGERPRIGYLFPGQGAPVGNDVPDQLVQHAIVAASVQALGALRELGIEADFAVGHSVGELAAYHWAGALDTEAVLALARMRGEVMTEHASAAGGMANIEADDETLERILDGAEVTVACFNSPLNRVVSGPVQEVDAVVARAREADGARALKLGVVGAFHSPLMRDVAPVFERRLAEFEFGPLQRPVYSTISGEELAEDADLRGLLVRQITEPVQFKPAVSAAAGGADLLIEVGPGRMLSQLVKEFVEAPAVPLRVDRDPQEGLLAAAGAASDIGVPVRTERLESGLRPDAGTPRP